jgi:threonine/homoserine/homoserine lactone efflux protein
MISITSGLLLGIIYTAAPGPISIETLRQGIKGGFIPSLAVQTGAALGLILYALLALVGPGALLTETKWQLAAGLSGTAVLCYLGITTIRDGRKLIIHPGDSLPDRTSARHALGTGALLSLANPLEILFWLSLGSHIRHDLGSNTLPFLISFFIGYIITSLVVVCLASFCHARLTTKTARTISWICGLALITFGLKLALSLGQHFIQP